MICVVHVHRDIEALDDNGMLDILALGQIGTKIYRHLRRHIGTETNWHFGKILIYFHVYSTFSKK